MSNDAMREALDEAAQSLESIAKLAGRDYYMDDMVAVRAYARSRALVARAALAQSEAQPEARPLFDPSNPSQGYVSDAEWAARKQQAQQVTLQMPESWFADMSEEYRQEAWRIAASPQQAQPVEMSPEFTDTARAALLWVLWHHQGGSSPIGQPLRFALGMGAHDRLNEHQIAEAKRWAEITKSTTADFHKHKAQPVPEPLSFTELCAVMPEDFKWGDPCTPKLIRAIERIVIERMRGKV